MNQLRGIANGSKVISLWDNKNNKIKISVILLFSIVFDRNLVSNFNSNFSIQSTNNHLKENIEAGIAAIQNVLTNWIHWMEYTEVDHDFQLSESYSIFKNPSGS